ncbi:MAG: amino acid ABC transporter permease [Acidimicrobiia bacterium]|nr:amino acid ABC transporter permease [Acidimicrobiia bacterium]
MSIETNDLAVADAPSSGRDRGAVVAIALSSASVALAVLGGAVAALRASHTNNNFLVAFVVAFPLGVFALWFGRRAETRVVDRDGPEKDEQLARAARRVAVAGITLGAMLAIGLGIWSAWTGLEDVQEIFFSPEHLGDSAGLVSGWPASGPIFEGFLLNVKIFVVAEILVLVWALVVALVRDMPGRAAAPLRWLAIAYVDIFRGLPAIITIYLVMFGLPITQLPGMKEGEFFGPDASFLGFDQVEMLGIFALVLIYGAYVAEVYRSGIESVHWSQRAAAQGLGLSRGQSMRYVVVPQAVRRVIPPLMNDFIGLQKDTALLNIAGVFEGFAAASNYANNNFNLSSVTGLGICFIIITIPMTRLTDYLVKRGRQRTQAAFA